MVQTRDIEGFYNCDLSHWCQFSYFPLVQSFIYFAQDKL